MLKLYRTNGVLNANVIIKKVISPQYVDILSVSEKPQMLDVDILYKLLERNDKLLVEMDGKFTKPDLYTIGKMLNEKKYEVVDVIPEVEKEVKVAEPVVEENKVEEEQPEEIKEETPANGNAESQQNKNRKQRHQK